MKGWLLVVLGVVVAAVGTIWTLQGLNVIGGSAMSGVTLWAVIGPIVFLAGLVPLVVGIRLTGRGDRPTG